METALQLNLLITVCLICWSTWGLFDKKALESAGHLDVLLFQHVYYALEVPVVLFILNCLFSHGWQISPEVWLWTGLGSGVSSSGALFYLVAMGRAEASFVLGITAAYPLLVQVLAHFFLNEALVNERMLGSVLVGLGVALVGSSRQQEHPDHAIHEDDDHEKIAAKKKSAKRHHLGILLMCLLATLCWALTGLFDKKAINLDQPIKVYFARCLWDVAFLLVMLAIYRLRRYKVAWNAGQAWKFAGLSSLCLSLGTLSYMFAMPMATASYLIVITGCYPLLMYLFAVLFLKERLSKMRLLGVVLVVAGGLMVQQTQGL